MSMMLFAVVAPAHLASHSACVRNLSAAIVRIHFGSPEHVAGLCALIFLRSRGRGLRCSSAALAKDFLGAPTLLHDRSGCAARRLGTHRTYRYHIRLTCYLSPSLSLVAPCGTWLPFVSRGMSGCPGRRQACQRPLLLRSGMPTNHVVVGFCCVGICRGSIAFGPHTYTIVPWCRVRLGRCIFLGCGPQGLGAFADKVRCSECGCCAASLGGLPYCLALATRGAWVGRFCPARHDCGGAPHG